MFADKHGAVYWDLAKASPHLDVHTAYFYDIEERAVAFKANVEFMAPKQSIRKEEERYIGNWRKINWNMPQDSGQVWLKLNNIFPLKRRHRLLDFQKASDGRKLERVRNFAIVKDPHFKNVKTRFSLAQYFDDYVYRLASGENEKLREKDIEEMLWFLMLDRNLEFVERQKGGDNRIDISFKKDKNNFVIIEIKKGTAGLKTLSQLKDYMKKISAERSPDKLLGIILCRKTDIDLREHIKNEKDIMIEEYRFKASFPTIEKYL